MAQEIEIYLLSKLNKGLDQSPQVPFAKEFKEIFNLLDQKLHVCSPSSLRGKLYSLIDIFSECQSLSGKYNCLSSSVRSIRNNLSKIKEGIKSIEASTSNGGITSSSASAGSASELHGLQVYGFEDDIISLEKLVVGQGRTDDSFKAIGVVGNGGVGKSTLCQLLLTRPKVKSYFVPRIWVDMSKRRDEDNVSKMMRIVKTLLDLLGVEETVVQTIDDENGLGGLTCALHVELIRKKYLIVLDNVQDAADHWYSNLNASLPRDLKWEERLAYGFPKGYGGTVIVTGRNEELMKTMVDKDDIHRLLPLSNRDLCWDIFSDEVGDELKQYLLNEELKSEVIAKCVGVPLAAKMMGQIMKDRIKERSVPSLSFQTQPSIDNNSITSQ